MAEEVRSDAEANWPDNIQRGISGAIDPRIAAHARSRRDMIEALQDPDRVDLPLGPYRPYRPLRQIGQAQRIPQEVVRTAIESARHAMIMAEAAQQAQAQLDSALRTRPAGELEGQAIAQADWRNQIEMQMTTLVVDILERALAGGDAGRGQFAHSGLERLRRRLIEIAERITPDPVAGDDMMAAIRDFSRR